MSQLSTKLPWDLAQTKWASVLNPLLAVPMLSGNQIKDIDLVTAVPKVINHLLQRVPQGWFLMDNTENAVVWRAAEFNLLTITLVSNADTSISIWVF